MWYRVRIGSLGMPRCPLPLETRRPLDMSNRRLARDVRWTSVLLSRSRSTRLVARVRVDAGQNICDGTRHQRRHLMLHAAFGLGITRLQRDRHGSCDGFCRKTLRLCLSGLRLCLGALRLRLGALCLRLDALCLHLGGLRLLAFQGALNS